METMKGIDAIRLAQEISRIPDGTFVIAFYKYNRVRGKVSTQLQVMKGCKARKQLPRDRFWIDSDNYFLFQDSNSNPKTAYRILIRYMGFPQDGYKLRKINWL